MALCTNELLGRFAPLTIDTCPARDKRETVEFELETIVNRFKETGGANVLGINETSGRTRLITLLGNPTGHSLSPAIHSLSFQLLGIDAEYQAFDVNNDSLGEIVDELRAADRWDGGNVTMPCKQAIIKHLDGLDEAAKLIGAVNVLKKTDGKVVGYNTDGRGFMVNLVKHGANVPGSRMVLLGPGGAGSAILVQAALDGVAHIDVFARAGGESHRHAQELAGRVRVCTSCVIELHDIADAAALKACIQDADILVNATPIGMGDGCDETPVPPDFIKPGMVVADAIYHPRETRLIIDAQAHGCNMVPGLGMLIEQAAASEAIWYGVQMPIEQIERELF